MNHQQPYPPDGSEYGYRDTNQYEQQIGESHNLSQHPAHAQNSLLENMSDLGHQPDQSQLHMGGSSSHDMSINNVLLHTDPSSNARLMPLPTEPHYQPHPIQPAINGYKSQSSIHSRLPQSNFGSFPGVPNTGQQSYSQIQGHQGQDGNPFAPRLPEPSPGEFTAANHQAGTRPPLPIGISTNNFTFTMPSQIRQVGDPSASVWATATANPVPFLFYGNDVNSIPQNHNSVTSNQAVVMPPAPVESPEAPEVIPSTELNALEGQYRYSPWTGAFSSLADAEHYLWGKRRWRPQGADYDRSIPRTEHEILRYAKELYEAIIDLDSGFIDKKTSKNKVNRLVNRVYHPLEIEARCVQIVYMTKDLHEHGSRLLPSSDITYADPKGKSRTDDHRGIGSDDWKPKAAAQRERDMSFQDRWREICLAVRTCKATATDLLDGKKMEDIIYAPSLSRKVKSSNKQNNDNKQKRLLFAKDHAPINNEVPAAAGGRGRKRRREREDELDEEFGSSSRRRVV